jgi:hypothetical protein
MRYLGCFDLDQTLISLNPEPMRKKYHSLFHYSQIGLAPGMYLDQIRYKMIKKIFFSNQFFIE